MLPRLTRYGNAANTYDLLKAFAMLTMIVDHVGMYLLLENTWLRLVGRLAFPLFFYAMGYSLQYRFRWEVAVCAMLIVAAKVLGNFPILPFEILSAVLVSRFSMRFLMRFEAYVSAHPFQILVAGFLYNFALMFLIDYGAFGVLFMLCGYYARKSGEAKSAGYNMCGFIVLVCVLHGWLQAVGFEFSASQNILLLMGLMAEANVMLRFSVRRIKQFTGAVSVCIRLLSRYSLEIYVLHYLVFMAFNYALYPAEHKEFRWYKIEDYKPAQVTP